MAITVSVQFGNITPVDVELQYVAASDSWRCRFQHGFMVGHEGAVTATGATPNLALKAICPLIAATAFGRNLHLDTVTLPP